jgi:hypothetical protein
MQSLKRLKSMRTAAAWRCMHKQLFKPKVPMREICGRQARISRFRQTDTSDLRVMRPGPVSTAGIGDYIVRTSRNRALPSATRS